MGTGTDMGTDTATGSRTDRGMGTEHKHRGEHSRGWQDLVVGAAVSAARVGGEASGGGGFRGARLQPAWRDGRVGGSRARNGGIDTGTDTDTGAGRGTGPDPDPGAWPGP